MSSQETGKKEDIIILNPEVKKLIDWDEHAKIAIKERAKIAIKEASHIEKKKELVKTTIESVKKSKEFINALNKQENEEIKKLIDNEDEYAYLYPNVLDPQFNLKIAEKKEFYDSRYNLEKKDVVKEAELSCHTDFEVSPHQTFVRNFLSFLTPYNCLLLFHGLGTGKTCSAISVCEEMRDYIKQTGLYKKILIIASPNVQENFKLQLFDERKLKEINGLWNLKACTGNKLLNEVNPMNMQGLEKKRIVKQIKQIIRQYYSFMGYTTFSNTIENIRIKYKHIKNKQQRINTINKHISMKFSNRLIVIDEVHNIRVSSNKSTKKIIRNLLDLVKHSLNIKLLLLSATPMFNSYKEIIFIMNLFNLNDNRAPIEIKDIFDKTGNFKVDATGNEIGKKLLIQKTRGYISFVQGENPYNFPYRIFPKQFDKENSYIENPNTSTIQLNGIRIQKQIKYGDYYMVKMSDYQQDAYEFISKKIKRDIPTESMLKEVGLGWKDLTTPLQALNITYPSVYFNKYSKDKSKSINIDPKELIGHEGLKSIMNYNKSKKNNFEYKEGVVKTFGRVFASEIIGNYSCKIKSLIDSVLNSTGIVLVFSQYIEGGVIPIALALEEIGITRYGKSSNLFKNAPTSKINALTMKPKKTDEAFSAAKYIIISGDIKLSPNNAADINASTNNSNINGGDIKVIIITKAGSEGIDFKNIRQAHILEPWYNNNRNEQIIGRAVRYCSHSLLPFNKRNVEIYLYGTRNYNEHEPLDMYIYRSAEYKSIKIGKVARVLKETAVDCILNKGNTGLTEAFLDQSVDITLSSGKDIEYNIGLKSYSSGCDYMEDCSYKCEPNKLKDGKHFGENILSYNERVIVLNVESLMNKIRELYTEKYIYTKKQLIYLLTEIKEYPDIQINSALTQLINDKNEFLTDMFGRKGHLINIDTYYLFQPIEFVNSPITTYERIIPIDFKRAELKINMKKSLKSLTISKPKKSETKIIITDIIKKIKNFVSLLDKKDIKIKNTEQVTNFMQTEFPTKFTDEVLEELLLESQIDLLMYSEKKELIEYLLKDELTPFEKKIKAAINSNILLQKGELKVYWLYDNKKSSLFTIKDKTLVKIIHSEMKKLTEELKSKKYESSKFNKYITFTTLYKKRDLNMMVFKMKEISVIQDRGGSRCDQAPIKKVKPYLENFLSNYKDMYTKFLEDKKISGGKIFKKVHYCILLELIARYNNKIKLNGKLWYFSYEESMINGIKM